MVENSQGSAQRRARPTLELSMIVKDGALGLARCLDSVDGIVDRIMIGDTGSTDETVSIARQYNAEVVPVPWEDDFARARNHVLARGQCDWILMLDADEMLDAEARVRIPALMAQETAIGYDVDRWNYVRELDYRCGGKQAVVNPVVIEQARAYPAYFQSLHTRLFRRRPDVYYEHCVHETVSDCMDRLKLPRLPGNFLIHHFGFVEGASEGKKEKERYYHSLGLQKLALNPDSFQAHLEIGMSELDGGQHPAAALPHFQKACSLEPRSPLARLYAGICLGRMGRSAEARASLLFSVRLDPSNPLPHSALGDLYFQGGDYANSREAYRSAQALGDSSQLSSAKLGAAEVQLGECEKGVDRIQRAIAESPSSGELYGILATSALIAGQHHLACEAADHRLQMEGATAFHFVLAASICLHTNKPLQAETILEKGRERFPDDMEINALLANSFPHHQPTACRAS
jgi:tetratricopeptide (TPR) repeat protein